MTISARKWPFNLFSVGIFWIEFDFELFKIPKFMQIVKFGPCENIFGRCENCEKVIQVSDFFSWTSDSKCQKPIMIFDEWQNSRIKSSTCCARVKNWVWKRLKKKMKIRKKFQNFEIHATNNWRETNKFRVNLNFWRHFGDISSLFEAAFSSNSLENGHFRVENFQ